LVYKVKKENNSNSMFLKKDFSPLFFKRNAYICVAMGLRIYWRLKTCVDIQRKKKRKKRKKRKRSGEKY